MSIALKTTLIAASLAGAAVAAPSPWAAPWPGQPGISPPASAPKVRMALNPTQVPPGQRTGGKGGPRPCECPGWDNGPWDHVNGQASHEGGGQRDGAQAADDFYLEPGAIYQLTSISGTLLTDSYAPFRGARLELYADCNGSPGELLYTFAQSSSVDNGVLPPPDTTFHEIVYTFLTPHVVLHSGAYWVSIIGLTDGRGTDESYFATANDGVIRGSVAKKRIGSPVHPPGQYRYPDEWTTVTDCCVGCTDLAFTVCATPCNIIWDNGRADITAAAGGSPSERSNGSNRARTADDFVINPCRSSNLCYAEAWVFTNCTSFTGLLEIYGNDCNMPVFALTDTPLYTAQATVVVDTLIDRSIEGRTMRLYKLEFQDLSYPLVRGTTYWFSAAVQATYSFNERSYFAYNADCTRGCLIYANAGKVIAPGRGITAWTATTHDYAFLLASTRIAGNADTQCPPDFNNDGVLNSNDFFDYVHAFIAGCP